MKTGEKQQESASNVTALDETAECFESGADAGDFSSDFKTINPSGTSDES